MYKTEQENFWAGGFGTDYIQRNRSNKGFSSKLGMFSKIMARTSPVERIIEFGSNIGLNLLAISELIGAEKKEFSAIEINEAACQQLRKAMPDVKIYNQSILDFQIDHQRDFVLVCGVLIHISPDFLQDVYDILYQTSNKYLCLCEYYNPTPMEISYRGHEGKLFKRDFAGEMLDRFPELTLIDYGFVYHRDYVFPGDDITWFLLEKRM